MGFRTRAANVSGLESLRQSRTERPGRPGPPPTIQDRSHHAVQEHSLGPPHREGYPPRPGVPPSVQHRSFRGPHRGGKPRRNLRWNFSMGYPSHAPPRAGLMSPPHHSFEHPKPGNHGISWGILRIAGALVNQRGWCSRLWLMYFLSTHD